MARPTVSAYTERLFARWPEYYRAADEATDWTLLRWLSLAGDEADSIEQLLDRITDLVDPELGDVAWLTWQARFGVDITGLSERDARTAIANIATQAPASTNALIQAIQSRLLEPKRAELFTHLDGNAWLFGAAIHPDDIQSISWDALEAEFPDWASIEASSTWDGLGDIDPLATLLVLQHVGAGFRLETIPTGSWWGVESIASWDALEADYPSWDDVELAPFTA